MSGPGASTEKMDMVVDTADCDELESALNAHWMSCTVTSVAANRSHTRLRRSSVGSTRLYSFHLGFPINYSALANGQILLARIHSGKWELGGRGEPPTVFGPGGTVAYAMREGERYNGHNHPSVVDVFLLDRALLTAVGAETSHGGDAEVFLTDWVPVSDAANRQLVAAVDHVRYTVVSNPEAMQYPLVAGNVQRYLAASVLSTFPNTAALEHTRTDRCDTSPTLRRAIVFIEENAHGDITVADIAAAAYVSPRALQYVFRTHRDCTPMEYVRQVRLHHARLDLLAADPDTATVAEVAQRWGFGHAGRFAVRYREAYGESPTATLRG